MHHLTCPITCHFQSTFWVNVFWGCQKWMLRARSECWEQEVNTESKKWMLKKDEAHQQASRTRSFHHVTNSGLRCTPKMVHTTSRGVHPKWYTPRGVVHTTSSGVHLNWSTPQGVIHTKSCSHHQHTHRKLLANYDSADSLTIQKILLYRS